ncbi:MAG TPA: hypothetical protein VF006_16465 [Longimicrobium sp.]
MRTIVLKEHQRAAHPLAPAELDQVLAAGVVDVRPTGAPGEYELHPGSTVGTVVLPSLRLLLRPKTPLSNLFFLLGFGKELAWWKEPPFDYAEEPDLLRAVGWLLAAEIGRALTAGLVHGYVETRDTLSTLRGRIDTAAQIRARQGRPYPFDCRFDEFTTDVELNRLVKAAIVQMLKVPELDPALVRALRHHLRSFAEVSLVEYARATVPQIAFTRLNAHWETAARLARLVLANRTVADREGGVAASSFTLNMNTLFERFVQRAVRRACRGGVEVLPNPPRPLMAGVQMHPDLVLRSHGRDVAVADVKYKLPENVAQATDLYQLLAYCTALGLPSGTLIYAGTLAPSEGAVINSGIRLASVAIDLSQRPPDLLRQTEAVARGLIAEVTAEDPRARRTAAA